MSHKEDGPAQGSGAAKGFRRKLILILKLAVAAGLILWLVLSGKIDFHQLENVGGRWPWFVIAQVPFALVQILCAYRWRHLLKAQGIDYSLGDVFALNMIGQLFNQFMIGTTGGDMVKAYAVAMEQRGRRSAGVISVFVDRVVGLLVLVGVALVAILFNLDLIIHRPDLVSVAVLVVTIFFGSLAGGYVFYSERIRQLKVVRWGISKLPFRRVLAQLSQAIYIYKFHPREVLIVIAMSVAVHLCVVSTNLCLARALVPEALPWANFFFLIPIAQIAMAIPINPPGAIGTAEGIYAYLLTIAGISQGALICLLYRLTNYFWALVGCFYYLKRKGKLDQAVEAARHDEEEAREADDSLDSLAPVSCERDVAGG